MKISIIAISTGIYMLLLSPMVIAQEGCLGPEINVDLSRLKNGFCDHHDYWIPGIPIWETVWMRAPDHSVGDALWYAEGMMEIQAKYKGVNLDLYLDGIAIPNCGNDQETAWLRRPEQEWEGPYVVLDCAAPQHVFYLVYEIGEVAEVGYQTALQWGLVENGSGNIYRIPDIEVAIGENPPVPDSVAIEYRGWWLDQAVFTNGVGYPRVWEVSPEPED